MVTVPSLFNGTYLAPEESMYQMLERKQHDVGVTRRFCDQVVKTTDSPEECLKLREFEGFYKAGLI